MQNGQMQSIPLVWCGPAEGYAGTDWLGSSSAEKALGFLPNSRVNKSQQCVLTDRTKKGQEHSGLYEQQHAEEAKRTDHSPLLFTSYLHMAILLSLKYREDINKLERVQQRPSRCSEAEALAL